MTLEVQGRLPHFMPARSHRHTRPPGIGAKRSTPMPSTASLLVAAAVAVAVACCCCCCLLLVACCCLFLLVTHYLGSLHDTCCRSLTLAVTAYHLNPVRPFPPRAPPMAGCRHRVACRCFCPAGYRRIDSLRRPPLAAPPPAVPRRYPLAPVRLLFASIAADSMRDRSRRHPHRERIPGLRPRPESGSRSPTPRRKRFRIDSMTPCMRRRVPRTSAPTEVRARPLSYSPRWMRRRIRTRCSSCRSSRCRCCSCR